MRSVKIAVLFVAAFQIVAVGQQSRSTGRALAIEDYYRIQTVAGPEISPDGRWVVFTVATRIEDDNSTRTEVHVVPSDASARPRARPALRQRRHQPVVDRRQPPRSTPPIDSSGPSIRQARPPCPRRPRASRPAPC